MKEFDIQLPDNVLSADPVGYLDMVMLEKNAKLIATDSGGVQKEAYFHKTPCITLRDETEWVELVEHGFNQLLGASKDMIKHVIDQSVEFPENSVKLYGEGNAGNLIVNELIENLK